MVSFRAIFQAKLFMHHTLLYLIILKLSGEEYNYEAPH